jgi:hypothetical protein
MLASVDILKVAAPCWRNIKGEETSFMILTPGQQICVLVTPVPGKGEGNDWQFVLKRRKSVNHCQLLSLNGNKCHSRVFHFLYIF